MKTARLPMAKQAALLARQAEREERIAWLETLIDRAPARLFVKDAQSRFVVANREVWACHDLPDEDAIRGKTDFDLYGPEQATEFFEVEQSLLTSGRPLLDLEEDIALSDGRRRCILTSKIPLTAPGGAPIGLVGFSYDISSRKEAENLMLEQASMFSMVARSLPLQEIVSSILLSIEERLSGSFGSVQLLSPDGKHLCDAIAPRLPAGYLRAIDGLAVGAASGPAGATAGSGETVIAADLLADPVWSGHAAVATAFGIRSIWSSPIMSYQDQILGTLSFYHERSSVPTNAQSDLIAMASYMVGIAIERKQAEKRIQFLAHHDALTGLPNRLTFEERLSAALEDARLQGGVVTLAFFDLDHFKLINDSMGHNAGDHLLKSVADRAVGCLGVRDVIARLGGDEFVVLTTDPGPDTGAAYHRLSALQKALATPVQLEGRSLRITLSMGVARFPDHGDTSAALLASADMAMYRAKAHGRDNIQVFSADMAAESEARLRQDQELRAALAAGQLTLHYQKQVDIESGRIFAVEALVRWNHPERGLVPPGDFIPLAEENGLIIPIGEWVLKTACAQNRAWQDAGLSPVVVSVNVSRRQFLEANWALRVSDILRETGLHPRYLELEITESLIMEDLRRTRATLAEINALGVSLAIDDFGTGYSSLSALKSFPVSVLKIDRSFMKDIPGDADDMAITAAIVSLAQKLGLRVIAEGVEIEAQIEFLRESGCREVQGYIFGRPLDGQSMTRALLEQDRVMSLLAV